MNRRDLLLTALFSLSAPGLGRAASAKSPDGKPNPYLSAPIYGITHFNSAQTDTLPYAVKRGTFRPNLAQYPRAAGGPVNIMNLAATQPGFMWAISSERVAYVDAAAGRWKVLADIGLPGVTRNNEDTLQKLIGVQHASLAALEALCKELFGQTPAELLRSGLYSLADSENTVYTNVGSTLHAFGLKDTRDPSRGLEVKRSLDCRNVFQPLSLLGGPPAVNVVGLGMTYDGHLIIGSTNGVAIIDRHFTKPAIVHTIENGQFVSNSFCVDENNGIYLASGSLKPRGDGILRKLVWTGSRISTSESDGAWSSPYDGGDWPPAIKAGTGTGSTPTLMGYGGNDERLVVLTDGANRMKIVAFWRDRIPGNFKQKQGAKSRRIADQMLIGAGLPASAPWIQSEQSVVVNGFGAFVVNNVVANGHPDKLVDVLAVGPLIDPPRGMERVEWDRGNRRWRSVWTRGDVASTSMVPVASAPSGIVFVNGYSKADGWEVTGLDWKSGKTIHRTIFGQTNFGNGAYAILQFMPNGDLLFNSVGGPVRIALE